MVGQKTPTRKTPSQPLESIELRNFKVTPETLDEALKILRQVLEEAKTNDNNSHND